MRWSGVAREQGHLSASFGSSDYPSENPLYENLLLLGRNPPRLLVDLNCQKESYYIFRGDEQGLHLGFISLWIICFE